MFKYLLILCLVIYLIYLFRYNNTENFLGSVNNTKLIGVTSSGEIYGFDGINPVGARIPGALVYVHMKNNLAWGVNSGDEIWYSANVNNPSATNWNKLPGLLTQISCDDFEGKLVGVNKTDDIYIATTGINSNPNWTQIPGKLINVSISNNKMYGVNRGNEIFYKPDITIAGNWVKLPGSLKQIVYTEGGGAKLVGVNSTNDVYYADAGLTSSPNWVGLNKKMKYVTLYKGYVMGIDLEGAIWTCNPKNKQWMKTNLPTNLNQISLYPFG
jgi:hypothetical protein